VPETLSVQVLTAADAPAARVNLTQTPMATPAPRSAVPASIVLSSLLELLKPPDAKSPADGAVSLLATEPLSFTASSNANVILAPGSAFSSKVAPNRASVA
jgi:hypothetical protein